MGVTRRRKTYRFGIDSWGGLVVHAAGLSYGELVDVRALGGDTDVPGFLAEHVTSWNVVDDDGESVAPDRDGFASLDPDDLLAVFRTYIGEVTGSRIKDDPLELGSIPMSVSVPA
jgi:hypothetical protein